MYEPDEENRLRREALEGAIEDGDVMWFVSPPEQHRRRQAPEHKPD